MDFEKTWNAFWEMLHDDIKPESGIENVQPLLAHYTSLQNLENILSNEELWLSNPLYMNDWEEVRFGVNNGVEIAHLDDELKEALKTKARKNQFFKSLDDAYDEYAKSHVLDLYVLCFSEHKKDDEDGKLSMWRGYGNAGKGAALIIDTSKISIVDHSPLVISSIAYASQEQRKDHIKKKINQVAKFIKQNNIPDEYVHAFADALFQRICLYAIFLKHKGFDEEEEWRLVYFKDRDPEKRLAPFFDYFNGPDGIQPKLKLPAKPIEGLIRSDFVFSDIVHSIIIGPTSSSPLTKHSVERMLDKVGKAELKSVIKMSSIPFRA